MKVNLQKKKLIWQNVIFCCEVLGGHKVLQEKREHVKNNFVEQRPDQLNKLELTAKINITLQYLHDKLPLEFKLHSFGYFQNAATP